MTQPPQGWTGRASAKSRGVPPRPSDFAQRIDAVPTIFLAGGDDAEVAPRVVHLGQEAPDWYRYAGIFPPFVERSFPAGIVYGAGGADWREESSMCAALELTYGHGAVQSTIFADWKPGAYQLPPVSSLRVAVRPWGYLWAETAPSIDYVFTTTIVRGQLADAALHPLTLTSRATLKAGFTSTLYVPPHARSCEVLVSGDDGAGPVEVSNGLHRRVVDAPTIFPITAVDALLQLRNLGTADALVTLCFYLAP